MNDLTHLSLFTGIGGIDLAAELAGFRTVGQCENNPYALRVLRNRFGRRISRWTDIHTLTADDFRRRTGIDSPTIVTGGFPCQPFSCAGKRRGKEDDRHLWPEMFRVVRELWPAWVLGENVIGIINMELDACIADLESEDYTVRTFIIPVIGAGTDQWRYRVFFVANSNIQPSREKDQKILTIREEKRPRRRSEFIYRGNIPPPNREIYSPLVCGSVDGVPHRMDRMRCLGNAVVPQQVFPILAGIAQIEQETSNER